MIKRACDCESCKARNFHDFIAIVGSSYSKNEIDEMMVKVYNHFGRNAAHCFFGDYAEVRRQEMNIA